MLALSAIFHGLTCAHFFPLSLLSCQLHTHEIHTVKANKANACNKETTPPAAPPIDLEHVGRYLNSGGVALVEGILAGSTPSTALDMGVMMNVPPATPNTGMACTVVSPSPAAPASSGAASASTSSPFAKAATLAAETPGAGWATKRCFCDGGGCKEVGGGDRKRPLTASAKEHGDDLNKQHSSATAAAALAEAIAVAAAASEASWQQRAASLSAELRSVKGGLESARAELKEASARVVARAVSTAAEKKRQAREAAEDGGDAPGFANPRAEFRAVASVKKAITRESASIVDGKAVASKERRAGIYRSLLKVAFDHMITEKEKEDKDLAAVAKFLPTWAADDIMLNRHIVEDNLAPRLRYAGLCRSESERIVYGVGLAFAASTKNSQYDLGVRRKLGREGSKRGIQNHTGPAYYGAAERAAAFDEANGKWGHPIKVGDKVTFRYGVGTLLSRNAGDGSVVVKQVLKVKRGKGEMDHEVTFPFKSAGKGKGGARPGVYIPTLAPPGRQQRSDTLPAKVVADIRKAWNDKGATSPNAKDEHRVRIAPGRYFCEGILYVHCSGYDVWQHIKDEYPSTYTAIKLQDESIVPNAVYDWIPENARRKGGGACLCYSCENTRLTDKARHAAGSLLQDHADELKEAGTAVDPRLTELIGALSQPSKGDFVRALTCGGVGVGLEDCDGACTDYCKDTNGSACPKCGFGRLWSAGLRPLLIDLVDAPQEKKGKKKKKKAKSKSKAAGGAMEEEEVVAKVEKLKPGIGGVWSEELLWSTYVKQPKPEAPKKPTAADEDEAYEQKKASTVTVVVNMRGSLIDFLDTLEGIAGKHIYHRGILSRQMRSAKEYEQVKRPGMLELNIDFAENATIEQARLLQGDHWVSDSCTLFICVASWLDKGEWDSIDSKLSVMDEVTVFGEGSGSDISDDPYWGRVVDTDTPGDTDWYLTENAGGMKEWRQRSILRRRVQVQECHASVSDDKTHDSFAMRRFVALALANLKSRGIIDSQGLRVLNVHSDNASQHFKSSKTLKWVSELRRLFEEQEGGTALPKFDSITYDFGPPGHGKGKWDGPGSILKGHLIKVNVRYLTWEQEMTKKPKGNPILSDTGKIQTAEDVAQQLQRTFATEAWRQKANRKERAPVSRFEVYYVPSSGVMALRPKGKKAVKYDRIVGISKSYQYFVLKAGAVAMRRHSCWCEACLRTAMFGPSALASTFEIDGCKRGASDKGLYEYENRSCRVLDGSSVGDANDRARLRGHKLAAGLDVDGGQFVLVEAYDEDDDGDVMWLGRTVAVDRFGKKCCKEMSHNTKLHDQESRSTMYSKGDYAIAVDWYERVADDPERRTFIRGDGIICYFNSTELRCIISEGGIVEAKNAAGDSCWEIDREEEVRGEDYCR